MLAELFYISFSLCSLQTSSVVDCHWGCIKLRRIRARVTWKKTTNINVLSSQQCAALSGIIERCFSAAGGHCGAHRDGLFMMWHWHLPQTRKASRSDARTWKVHKKDVTWSELLKLLNLTVLKTHLIFEN